MTDEQVIGILQDFDDKLTISDISMDFVRMLGWAFVQGIAWILDTLENVANEMLLVKEFYQNESVIEFVTSFRPLLYILLAFSLVYSGYLLVFQRKLQVETVAINFIIAMAIISLLSTATDKANDFSDEAVKAVNSGALFGSEEGTVSENILADNISDLVEFDRVNWAIEQEDEENKEDVKPESSIPIDVVSRISINAKIDPDGDDIEYKNDEVFKKQLDYDIAERKEVLRDLDQGGLSWNNKYYYRYSLDWFTIIVTMLVMAFTLFSIAYKLARLAFELVFNHLLVMIVAPADLHDGQKTKKIMQSILNTFLVIVLIFMSMKLYVIGTAYLADNFKGLVYIIALIGFSAALLDGPNMVERLFGIDAGLKGGWSVLAGTYAAGKMALAAKDGAGKMLSKFKNDKNDNPDNGKDYSKGSDSENSGAKNQNQSPLKDAEAKLPFDEGDKGNGKDSPLKPSLDGSDKGEAEQAGNSDIEANVDEKGRAAVSKSGETKGDRKDSDLQSSLGTANGASESLEATSQKEQEVKQNQDVQQRSAVGQAALKGVALDGATPDLEQQMNGEGASQGNGSSISRQGLTEQPVNITDMQNGTQTAAASSQGGSIQQATAPDQSLEQQAQPNITEGSTVQGGQNDVQRQSNAEQPVNITDVQNGTQTVTTSSQSGSVQQATAPDRSLEQQSQPNITEGSTVQGGQSDIQTQSNITQQVNVTDTQNSEQTVNTTSQAGTQTSTTSSQGASESPISTGVPKVSSEERVISESSSGTSSNQTTVQQENVNQVNEEIKVEESTRNITGSQSVSHVENGESGGGAAVAIAPAPAGVPKASSEERVLESEGQDRQHVINRKSKKDRFNRMKNQTKK
ncbi:pLS20_p028 family conjugation system transmembrane protein [Domibacillus robiginosus]|uniref:pLS20_p028 family conjugation system transmembrane protein n=1 Tax=Domibacillus robiginosus TaxID=1071054 RepID=UPI00067B03D1|nr:hypothetical protein [Domibacillus robiginosus]